MRDKWFLSFTKACHKDRFLLLIVFMVALVVLGPFIEGFLRLRFFMNLCFSIIFIATIYAVSQKRQYIIFAATLLIPVLLAVWTPNIPENNILLTTGYLCGLIVIAFAVISILTFIFSQQEVTRQTISAAVAVYLLLALMWTFIYRLIENLYPGSFAVAHDKLLLAENIYLYFSLVTITTLGYGDITPIGSQAVALSVLEAITGQIYLVVVVAWFVGLYVSKKSKQ
jgi:voltage-gated potassium channel Kch